MTKPFSGIIEHHGCSQPYPNEFPLNEKKRERGITNEEGYNMTKPFTGIVEHQGRLQPYTVWWKGRIVYFTDDKEIAERKLEAEKIKANGSKR